MTVNRFLAGNFTDLKFKFDVFVTLFQSQKSEDRNSRFFVKLDIKFFLLLSQNIKEIVTSHNNNNVCPLTYLNSEHKVK